jgi:hypothetical protein
MDLVSRWKYERWKLAQSFPGLKPSDFDEMGDAPWWVIAGFIDVKRYELQDCKSIINAQIKVKRKKSK